MRMMAAFLFNFCFAVSLLLAFKAVPAAEVRIIKEGSVYHHDTSKILRPVDFIVKTSNSKEVERINFEKGKATHLWKGTIWNGEKDFKLWIKKGQRVRLS